MFSYLYYDQSKKNIIKPKKNIGKNESPLEFKGKPLFFKWNTFKRFSFKSFLKALSVTLIFFKSLNFKTILLKIKQIKSYDYKSLPEKLKHIKNELIFKPFNLVLFITFITSLYSYTKISEYIIYLLVFFVLNKSLQLLDNDLPIVFLNITKYPALITLCILNIRFIASKLNEPVFIVYVNFALTIILLVVITIWIEAVFKKIIFYSLKSYISKTELLWVSVLLPVLEAVFIVILYIFIFAFFLNRVLGIDLNGIWVSIGGAGFIIGLSLENILSNFFSGVFLLIDTPFSFGDILILEDESICVVKKIGLRVTHMYIFKSHCDIYIPNNILQKQKITNLSRPTRYHQCTNKIQFPSMWNIARAKEQIRDVLLAHPDILGNIHAKLEFIDQYFQDENMLIFQSRGKARIISESKVIEKLDEIDITLEVFISTIEYSLKNGLDKGEIAFIQEEFIGILDLLGLVIMNEDDNSRNLSLQEANNQESLIESVRNWYREIINDENILEEDTFTISYEWELKIKVLIKRITKLAQKIMIINIDETRIYEVVADEKLWLKENFKQPQLKWQDPQVIMSALTYSEEYVQFTLLFFIDSPNFEYGKRVERITSQINEEIIKIFKKDYILGKLYNLDSLFGSDLEMESENSDISTVNEI